MKTKTEQEHGRRRTNIFGKVAASLDDLKTKLASADVQALQATITAHESTIAGLESQLAEARRIAAVPPAVVAELAAARQTIAELSSHTQSLAVATMDQVAALGFEASALPGIVAEAGPDTPTSAAAFMAKHAELVTKSPAEGGKFYAQYAAKFGYA